MGWMEEEQEEEERDQLIRASSMWSKAPVGGIYYGTVMNIFPEFLGVLADGMPEGKVYSAVPACYAPKDTQLYKIGDRLRVMVLFNIGGAITFTLKDVPPEPDDHRAMAPQQGPPKADQSDELQNQPLIVHELQVEALQLLPAPAPESITLLKQQLKFNPNFSE